MSVTTLVLQNLPQGYIFSYLRNPRQTYQRWINVDCQRPSTLFQRWNLVENESWADVYLLTLFLGWQNNAETTLIELRWFNVDDPILFQRWY